jgi:hypothetical protein
MRMQIENQRGAASNAADADFERRMREGKRNKVGASSCFSGMAEALFCASSPSRRCMSLLPPSTL